MSDEFPRRASSDTRNPRFHASYRRIGVLFDGVARNDVNEYDLDDGWIDVRERHANGKWKLGADGRYVLKRLVGKVEVYIRHAPKPEKPSLIVIDPLSGHIAKMEAAEAKRARKAAKLAAIAARREHALD